MFMKKARVFVAAAGMLALAVGCSSTVDTTPKPGPLPVPVNGQVIKGPVVGAKVWADKVVDAQTGLGNNIQDADEPFTTTKADGSFDMDLPAGFTDNYVFVTFGGQTEDPATGLMVAAAPMMAPKGAKRVTPITTLVALVPPAERDAFKASMGVTDANYDMDISAPENKDTVLGQQLLEISWVVQRTIALIQQQLLSGGKATDTAANLAIVANLAKQVKEEVKDKPAGQGLASVVANAGTIAQNTVQAVFDDPAIEKKPEVTQDTVNTVKQDAAKEAELAKKLTNPAIRIAKTTIKVAGQDRVIDTTQEVGLLPNEPHNVGSFAFEIGFTQDGLDTIADTKSRTWTNASVIMEAKNKAAGSKQNIKAVVSGVTVKVDRAGTVPTVTLTYGAATKLTITGTYASGEAINKVEIQDTNPQANAIVKAEGKNVTVDIAGLKEKIAKVDATLDQKIRGITFSKDDAYELKFSVTSGTEAGLLQAQTVNVKIQ